MTGNGVLKIPSEELKHWDVLPPHFIHHLWGGSEKFLRCPFDHFLLSGQLLNSQDDLLYVLDANLYSVAEILLKNVLCRGLHHHYREIPNVNETVKLLMCLYPIYSYLTPYGDTGETYPLDCVLLLPPPGPKCFQTFLSVSDSQLPPHQ